MKKHIIWVGMTLVALCTMSSCESDEDKEIDKAFKEKLQNSEAIQEAFKNVKSVTVSGQVNGYDYVDLGLPSGTKWATYNIGASKPTEYGELLSWGETVEKVGYSMENYKFADSAGYTKYIRDDANADIVLDAEDDAATVRWGGAWQMPTIQQLKELKDGCYWSWQQNFLGSDVNGMVGISTTNGSVIFLPGAGSIHYANSNDYRDLYGMVGQYWSSSLGEKSYYAGYFYANEGAVLTYEHLRYDGRSVRGVVK